MASRTASSKHGRADAAAYLEVPIVPDRLWAPSVPQAATDGDQRPDSVAGTGDWGQPTTTQRATLKGGASTAASAASASRAPGRDVGWLVGGRNS